MKCAMSENVQWIPVQEYPGYYVNQMGEIKKVLSKPSNRLFPMKYEKYVKQRIDRGGYCTVRLFKNGKSHTCYVHRIVAEAFIPRVEDKPLVNHRDSCKANNYVSNLEWASYSDNVRHAYTLGLIRKKMKPVINTCTGQVFISAKKASQFYSLPYSTCKNYLNGNRENPTCLRYVC